MYMTPKDFIDSCVKTDYVKKINEMVKEYPFIELSVNDNQLILNIDMDVLEKTAFIKQQTA